MVSKVKAVRSTMSFGVILTQFILGLHLLVDIFSSNKIVDTFLSGWKNFSLVKGYSGPMAIETTQLEAPIRFLFVILGFMIFSVILFSLVPKFTEKQERRMRIDYE
jgi:hypothetical protein